MATQRGRDSRARRLGLPGPVNLVAMDHGLSLGWTPTQDSPLEIIGACQRRGVQGAVGHAGLVARIPPTDGFEALMQLHGSTSADQTKVRVALPSLAAAADCVRVAVEFQSCGPSAAMSGTAELIQLAHDLGLVVLVMANYTGEAYTRATIAVVGASQLNADLIKLRLPSSEPSSNEHALLARVISDSCPVLVAGGDASTDLRRTLSMAKGLGMSGSCIGRHYFDAASRSAALEAVMGTFAASSSGAPGKSGSEA